MLAATSVATWPRKRLILGLAFGWTRLLRKITAVWLVGSIQRDVPVKPVWPKPPSENSSPRFDEYEVRTSHPNARNPPGTGRGVVISDTVAGLRTRLPS